jgi:hypothetical protein
LNGWTQRRLMPGHGRGTYNVEGYVWVRLFYGRFSMKQLSPFVQINLQQALHLINY